MKMGHHGAKRWILAACLAVASQLAVAGPVVDIKPLPALNLLPASSGTVTLAVQNTGDATADVNFLQFALMLVPTSGTGTLTLDAWNPPASNPMLGDPIEFAPVGGTQDLINPVTIDGTDYYAYFQLQGLNTDATNWPLGPGVTKNAGSITFTAGPAADNSVSTWDIYVVSQAYTSPATPPTFYANAAVIPSDFGNLPGVDGGKLKIGTVTVTAVPEPGSLTLAFAGVVGALGAVIRRTRRRPDARADA